MVASEITPLNAPPNQVGEDRGHHLFKRAFLTFFIIFLLGGSYFIGYEQGAQSDTGADMGTLAPEDAIIINKKSQDNTIDFALFWKVWEILRDKYVDRSHLDAHALFYGAIDGMLAASGDPYTTFFSPKENQDFNEEIAGVFDGIGAVMGIKDEIITIIAPLEGTPAEKAGLLSGDKVIKINDVLSSNYSLDEAVKNVRGPKGTDVKLTIFREGEEDTRDIVIMRDAILMKSVHFEMKEGGIASIRVNRFGEDTENLFQAAIKQLKKEKVVGLIVDLRNNPGGFLETAVVIASYMLPQGSVVVMEESANGKRKELKARGGDVLGKLPTVILINEGSASASEILAGALRESREDVVLVGKKSFGKGSVQELIPVSKDTSVKITVARWLTPQGKQIHGVGIAPDAEVSISTDDRANKRDPQFERALEEIKKLIEK
ncbi:MAG: S41 family peptidase [Candidatus Moranbacteria bacterium]|nr:S41 family peptidase [Candidatus Moranbacteria bacterium]